MVAGEAALARARFPFLFNKDLARHVIRMAEYRRRGAFSGRRRYRTHHGTGRRSGTFAEQFAESDAVTECDANANACETRQARRGLVTVFGHKQVNSDYLRLTLVFFRRLAALCL
jgi:hypothetical protein